jgi:sterol desaturase/sphingolipid hydroxylase (fatty acid hydroxylase superfamily)
MHLAHHGRMRRNFGATTDLWDRVFGTRFPASRRERA